MPAVPSAMLPLGTPLPGFSLPDTEGGRVTSHELEGRAGVLVMFLCNHCPYVKHLAEALARTGREAMEKGVGVVAIMSNDVARYPADSPEAMARAREAWGWTFPYLYDETQEVARAFQAACTPDFFLFDAEGKLAYRGQYDASRPGNDVPVTGDALEAALEAVLAGEVVGGEQLPSVGCSIKWKPEMAPGG